MIASYCLEKFDSDFVKFMGLEGLNLHNTSPKDQSYPAATAVDDTKQSGSKPGVSPEKMSTPSSFLVSRFLGGFFSWK